MDSLTIAVQSASILVREGFVAVLVIATLAGLSCRAGASDQLKALCVGACFALPASFEAAFISAAFLNGALDFRFDVVLMIVTSTLILSMSGWLYLRRDADDWDWREPRARRRFPLRFAAVVGARTALRAAPRTLGRAWITRMTADRSSAMRRSAERGLLSGTSMALAGIAFLVVFRAGVDTASSLQALVGAGGAWKSGVVTGLLAAMFWLFALTMAMQWLASRLSLRLMLVLPSIFLLVVGLGLIGATVQAMQVQLLLPYDGVWLPDWLAALGVHVTWEALGAQVAIAVTAVSCTLALSVRSPAVMVPAE